MAEMLQVIESLRAQEASVHKLFGDAGTRVGSRRSDPKKLLEANRFLKRIEKGTLPLHYLREAMTTSDFPFLFADIIDRKLLGYYNEAQPTWPAYCNKATVPDLRNVKRFAMDGAESTLPEVPENTEYPQAPLTDRKDEYAVKKYGRRIDLAWEAMINDDLDAFRRTPERLARAARRSESKFATELFVDTKGPHASLFKAEYKNIVLNAESKQPSLSIEALQRAMLTLAEMKDFDNEPIVVDAVTLVVPPALEVTAKNILNALQIWITNEGGTSGQQVHAQNWMRNVVTLQVEPYIPIVASAEHGSTSWFLFADPNVGRPAIELGFLRGYEQPSLYERMPTARRIGGGGGEVNESFEDDTVAWRIRHVLGGARLVETGGYKTAVASNGSNA